MPKHKNPTLARAQKDAAVLDRLMKKLRKKDPTIKPAQHRCSSCGCERGPREEDEGLGPLKCTICELDGL